MSQRRVVVTGLGLVTPLGVGVKTAWKNLINGHCGIVSLADRAGFEKLPVRIAAAVPQGSYEEGKFTASEWLDKGVGVLCYNGTISREVYIVLFFFFRTIAPWPSFHITRSLLPDKLSTMPTGNLKQMKKKRKL
jgi:hypothetical protein